MFPLLLMRTVMPARLLLLSTFSMCRLGVLVLGANGSEKNGSGRGVVCFGMNLKLLGVVSTDVLLVRFSRHCDPATLTRMLLPCG